jgi:hypothetical protein
MLVRLEGALSRTLHGGTIGSLMAAGKRQVTMRWEIAGKSHKPHKRDNARI